MLLLLLAIKRQNSCGKVSWFFALSVTLTAPLSGKSQLLIFITGDDIWALSIRLLIPGCICTAGSMEEEREKKGEKKIPCLINWVDLAWKILRDTNGSLKRIFLIFNFKVGGEQRELLMLFVEKSASSYGDIMMACGSFFLKAVTWSSLWPVLWCASLPAFQLHLIMWLHTHSSLCHSSHIPGF